MDKIEAVNYFGSKTRLAEALNIKPASVSQWSERIPEKRAMQLDRLTSGVLHYDPDDYIPPQCK